MAAISPATRPTFSRSLLGRGAPAGSCARRYALFMAPQRLGARASQELRRCKRPPSHSAECCSAGSGCRRQRHLRRIGAIILGIRAARERGAPSGLGSPAVFWLPSDRHTRFDKAAEIFGISKRPDPHHKDYFADVCRRWDRLPTTPSASWPSAPTTLSARSIRCRCRRYRPPARSPISTSLLLGGFALPFSPEVWATHPAFDFAVPGCRRCRGPAQVRLAARGTR